MVSVALSTTLKNSNGVGLCIDNDLDTICASQPLDSQYLSMRIAPNHGVTFVAVYNRRDAFASLFGTVEVFVGDSEGAATSSCGRRAASARCS